MRNDPVEAPEIVEREVGARDRVGALRRRDASHAPKRRHVDPGVVVAGLRGRLLVRLVAVGEQRDAARVEGGLHLGAEGPRPLLAAEEVPALATVLVLEAARELHALARPLVVKGKLLATVPVRVEEVGLTVAVLGHEVPHDLRAGARIPAAVDLLDREGLTGGVVLEAVVGAEAGLAPVVLARGEVLPGRRVVPVEGSDLELHALVEEEVPVRPELLRQIGLDLLQVLPADHVAGLEGRGRDGGVLRGASRMQRQRGQRGQGRDATGAEMRVRGHRNLRGRQCSRGPERLHPAGPPPLASPGASADAG
jgi:hypothetical protein